jgi:uncharacterized protein YbjT (DUF2867 family)
MKIVLIGATGTIGREISKALQQEHELVKVGSRKVTWAGKPGTYWSTLY